MGITQASGVLGQDGVLLPQHPLGSPVAMSLMMPPTMAPYNLSHGQAMQGCAHGPLFATLRGCCSPFPWVHPAPPIAGPMNQFQFMASKGREYFYSVSHRRRLRVEKPWGGREEAATNPPAPMGAPRGHPHGIPQAPSKLGTR